MWENNKVGVWCFKMAFFLQHLLWMRVLRVSQWVLFLSGSRALFTRLASIFFNKNNFKIGSHDTIHTFKNYFIIVFSVFSNKRYPKRPLKCEENYFMSRDKKSVKNKETKELSTQNKEEKKKEFCTHIITWFTWHKETTNTHNHSC